MVDSSGSLAVTGDEVRDYSIRFLSFADTVLSFSTIGSTALGKLKNVLPEHLQQSAEIQTTNREVEDAIITAGEDNVEDTLQESLEGLDLSLEDPITQEVVPVSVAHTIANSRIGVAVKRSSYYLWLHRHLLLNSDGVWVAGSMVAVSAVYHKEFEDIEAGNHEKKHKTISQWVKSRILLMALLEQARVVAFVAKHLVKFTYKRIIKPLAKFIAKAVQKIATAVGRVASKLLGPAITKWLQQRYKKAVDFVKHLIPSKLLGKVAKTKLGRAISIILKGGGGKLTKIGTLGKIFRLVPKVWKVGRIIWMIHAYGWVNTAIINLVILPVISLVGTVLPYVLAISAGTALAYGLYKLYENRYKNLPTDSDTSQDEAIVESLLGEQRVVSTGRYTKQKPSVTAKKQQQSRNEYKLSKDKKLPDPLHSKEWGDWSPLINGSALPWFSTANLYSTMPEGVRRALTEASRITGAPFYALAQMARVESGFNPEAVPIKSFKHRKRGTVKGFAHLGVRQGNYIIDRVTGARIKIGANAQLLPYPVFSSQPLFFITLSSAGGLFQNIVSTWKDRVKWFGVEQGSSFVVPSNASRFDPLMSAVIQGRFINSVLRRNANALSLDDRIAVAYIIHNLGEGDANRFLRALYNPVTKHSRIDNIGLHPSSYENNKGFFFTFDNRPVTVEQAYERYKSHFSNANVIPDTYTPSEGYVLSSAGLPIKV